MIKKVVIIGPESTGKSILCEQLATYFNTVLVPEYAREYLMKHGSAYNYEDIYAISQGQINAEDSITRTSHLTPQASNLIFIDTDLYVIKVWSEYVFNKCANRILRQIASRHYDLYLLCNTDIDWVQDQLREYPDPQIRKKLFHYYKEAMVAQAVPWIEIKGNYEERFKLAVEFVTGYLK